MNPSPSSNSILRQLPEGLIELVNAQNNGRVEVLRDTFDAEARRAGTWLLVLESVWIGNDPRMIKSRRMFTLRHETLIYTVEMATVNTPELQQHLRASLARIS